MPRLSEQELSDRSKGMGSTCMVEAAGLAPWKGAGPMRLFCEKLGIAPPDDAENDAKREEWLEWGHIQEPIIADWYAKTYSCSLIPGGRVLSQEHSFCWATLDRKIVGVPRLVEIKNVGSPMLYHHWDTSSQDGVPSYVRAQVNVAMRYTSIEECDVVAGIGGRPPHVWRVFYDRELADMLVKAGVEFWRAHVLTGTAPALDASDATRLYLRHKYPSNEYRTIVDATPEADLLGQERADWGRKMWEANVKVKELDSRLLNLIGAHDGMQGDGWKMTWKIDKSGKRRSRFTARGTGDGEE